MNKIIKYSFWLAVLYFSYLLILITIQYIPPNINVAFLITKSNVVHHLHYKLAFFTHVYTSIFCILSGFFLFSTFIRNRYLTLHKTVGKMYVITILFFSCLSGFIMSFYANGGWQAQLSFLILSVLWWVYTFKAYQYAVAKKIKLHNAYMIRSYALTLSAISLRLFKYIIVHIWALPPLDTYRIVAWLSWVVNLIIAEIIIIKLSHANIK